MGGPISDDRADNAITREPPGVSDSGNATTREHHDDANIGSQAVQHVRGTIPMPWGVALDHAVADLRITKAEAIRESVGLFLRFHGRAEGLPEPLPPVGRH